MSAVGRFRRLREMLDVTWPGSPVDGDVLTYDAATSKMTLAVGGGGGYTPPTGLERIGNAGGQVTTTNATFTPLPLVHQFGAALLDYTDPNNPTVVTAGIYAVTCQIDAGGGSSPTGYMYAQLDLDANAVDLQASATTPLITNGTNDPQLTLAATAYCPAGAVINVVVYQTSGGGYDIGVGRMWVQRIT